MNAYNPYLKQYKKNQIETATPEQVLILLYDGAIQYLNKAKVAIEQNNSEECSSNLTGAQRIILEFMNTLDMDNGGKLAQELYRLYDYLYNTLVAVNFSREVRKLDEVLRLLQSLRETWQKAIAISNAEKKVELIDNYEAAQGENHTIEYSDSDEDEEEDDET